MLQNFIGEVGTRGVPVAVVTGASGGVGAACARMLAKQGYACLLLGRRQRRLAELADEIQAETKGSVPACGLAVDLSVPGDIEQLSRDIHGLHSVGVLVLAAGITSGKTAVFEDAELQRILQVNLIAPMLCARHLLPLLNRSPDPYIINIASRAGLIGFEDRGLYGASKAAGIRYFDSLRAQAQGSGLRVTSICPGWVNTPMAAEGGCTLPPDKILQPDDVAAAVQWLICSPTRLVVRDLVLEVAPIH